MKSKPAFIILLCLKEIALSEKSTLFVSIKCYGIVYLGILGEKT